MPFSAASYLSGAIVRLIGTAAGCAFADETERRFLRGILPAMNRKSKVRAAFAKRGAHIPPFLIASVASECNLRCAGCYDRAGKHHAARQGSDMTDAQWDSVFSQADAAGVSFILLAGGEPLTRPGVLQAAAAYTRTVFPVFTNGTLLTGGALDFFAAHRNLIPIFSIEGEAGGTDLRRGAGVAAAVDAAMSAMKARRAFYGACVTVTAENAREVLSKDFVGRLKAGGCGILLYVDYVPAEKGTEHLAPKEDDRRQNAARIDRLRETFGGLVLISFPGDERHMGGCLAAGRGFFHINSAGGAEPCPFSPYSDSSLKTGTLLEMLDSPFFRRLREDGVLKGEHTGGCVLFERESAVRALV